MKLATHQLTVGETVSLADKLSKISCNHTIFHTATIFHRSNTYEIHQQGPRFLRQILPNSVPQFVKFRKILWHYYTQIPYIPWPVGVVILTDNTSKCKEFIVTCNTKAHNIRPFMTKIHVIITKVSLQQLAFIVL